MPPTQTRETSIDTVVFVWERTDTAYFQLEIINPENLTISTYFVEDSLKEIFTHFPLPPEEEEEEEEDGEGN